VIEFTNAKGVRVPHPKSTHVADVVARERTANRPARAPLKRIATTKKPGASKAEKDKRPK
jgi:hypothetical protein